MNSSDDLMKFEENIIVFTDIVGFTSLRNKLENKKYEEVLYGYIMKHDEIINMGLRKFEKGKVIKTMGDSFMIIFNHDEARFALDWAIHTQKQFAVSYRKYKFPIQIRISIDKGQMWHLFKRKKWNTKRKTEDFYEDYLGESVDRCNRILSLTEGSHILVSEDFKNSIKGYGKDIFKDLTLKPSLLKGIQKTTKIFEVHYSNKMLPQSLVSSDWVQLFSFNGTLDKYRDILFDVRSNLWIYNVVETSTEWKGQEWFDSILKNAIKKYVNINRLNATARNQINNSLFFNFHDTQFMEAIQSIREEEVLGKEEIRKLIKNNYSPRVSALIIETIKLMLNKDIQIHRMVSIPNIKGLNNNSKSAKNRLTAICRLINDCLFFRKNLHIRFVPAKFEHHRFESIVLSDPFQDIPQIIIGFYEKMQARREGGLYIYGGVDAILAKDLIKTFYCYFKIIWETLEQVQKDHNGNITVIPTTAIIDGGKIYIGNLNWLIKRIWKEDNCELYDIINSWGNLIGKNDLIEKPTFSDSLVNILTEKLSNISEKFWVKSELDTFRSILTR